MGGGEGMQEMCSHVNNNEGGKMEGGATKPRDGAIGHPNLGTLPPRTKHTSGQCPPGLHFSSPL